MFKHILTGCTLLIAATQVNARGIDLRLANEVAAIQYLTEASTFGYGGADVGVGFLFNSDDNIMLSADAMVSGHGAGNNRPLKFGVGVKGVGVYLDSSSDTTAAISIGVQLRYLIPASTPVAIMAEGFVAPKITSFSGMEKYTESRIALELEVTPSARAYIGYRKITMDFASAASIELDNSAHVGVKISF